MMPLIQVYTKMFESMTKDIVDVSALCFGLGIAKENVSNE